MAEGDMKMTSSSSQNENGHSEKNKEEKMDMNGKDKNMDMSETSHEPVREKPANLKVLGTYGAVNLSFIVFGVWNKWFRRKDGSNVNSK